MSSEQGSKNNGLSAADRKAGSTPESDEEPTNLVIHIKEEPKEAEEEDEGEGEEEEEEEEEGYREDLLHHHHHHSMTNGDDQCKGYLSGESLDEAESDYYKEIDIGHDSDAVHPRAAVSPCLPTSAAEKAALRGLKGARVAGADAWRRSALSSSRRLLPAGRKPAGPIPIALTVSKPAGAGSKPGASAAAAPHRTGSSGQQQGTAHHLMTLATEADKILKKQEKRLQSEKGSGSDHTDEGKQSNSEEEMVFSSSESSGGGGGGGGGSSMDPFLKSGDQTLTLIQRRAAEASLSSGSKKSKRKRSQLPDDMKDETYWERRRKNNEAAKRSRDARRAKEDQIAIRAALLEQENMRLRIEVAALKEETVRLKGLLYEKR